MTLTGTIDVSIPTLVLTPSGRLIAKNGDDSGAVEVHGWMKRAVESFSRSTAEGLFSLAASKPDAPLPPEFIFWRDFASLYLAGICRVPDIPEMQVDPVEPPEPELAVLLDSAPPMEGGEYLNDSLFSALWDDLDSWTRSEVSASGSGLTDWLAKHAPLWHQVGRVCFHLAENKNDPDYPFAFLATYAPNLSRGGRVQYLPLGRALQEYAGAKNRKALYKLLSPVHEASERVDFVRELVDSGDIYHPLAWTPAEAYRLLQSVPLLEESGLLVRLPDWWRKRPRPRVSVTIGENRQGRFGADSMLDFKVGLALGDLELTREEFERIMASEEGLVYVKGQWIEVDRNKLAEALDHWKKVERETEGQGISFIEGMRLLAGAPADLGVDGAPGTDEREWAFVDAGEWLKGVLAELRDPSALSSSGLRDGFRGTLRPYQETGLNWLRLLSTLGLGACLADDMGLGKTVQILSLLQAMKETGNSAGPSLLVLPATLLANWIAEMGRFTPGLKAVVVHPSETERSSISLIAGNPEQALSDTDVVMTTYGMLYRQAWLLDVRWNLVIIDEAQVIKNPSTRQAKAVKRLQSNSRIALTGTPVENRLSDLWSLFDFLCPGLLGSADRFGKFIKSMDQREHDRYAPLRNLVRPYILRRLKTDKSIIADLPDKTEMKAFCGLTKKQAALYGKSVEELRRALGESDGMKRRGLVLAYLMRLKQICNHPSQLLGDGRYEPGDSGKFDRLREICEEIASRQEKVLVFTQYREMTEPIADFLKSVFGRDGLILDGRTAVAKRKTLVDLFQQEAGPPFFVLSLKAGGTGLNLTAASHVVHFDRWWNPAVENQATDRTYRIGQHRNVVVHKFVCRGTVEEKIDELIEDKTNLAEDILQGGAESMLTEMSDDELLGIVALDIDRAMV